MVKYSTIVAINATLLVPHYHVHKFATSLILVHLDAVVLQEQLKMKRMSALLLINVCVLTKVRCSYQDKFMRKNVKIGKKIQIKLQGL